VSESVRLSRRRFMAAAAGGAVLPALVADLSAVEPASAAPALQASGGGLVVAQDTAFAVLDPAGAGKVRAEAEIVRHLFNNLVRFQADMSVAPDLSTSWTVSQDGATWTFALRTGVKFHDGSDFNADAVKFTFDRLVSADNAFLNRGLFASVISAVNVVDPATVAIVTQGAFGPLLNFLAHFSAGIVSPTAVQASGTDFATKPVGTGPYRAKEIVAGDHATLVKNPDYFGTAALADQLTFRAIVEEGARSAALESGQVDIATGLPAQDVDRLKGEGNTVVAAPSLQAQYLGINMARPNLDNVDVRHAINYAIDKQALVQSLFLGTFTELDSVLTPGTSGYQTQTPYAFDADKAKQLLAGAGFDDKNPLKLVLWSPKNLYPKDILVAQAIQSMLQNVGIDVSIEQKESASYFSDLKVPSDQAPYDLFMWAFVPSTGDGYQTFQNNLLSDTSDTPSYFNFSRYKNADFDAQVTKSRDETDQNVRTGALQQANGIAWNDAPYASLYVIATINGYRPGVSGVQALPTRYLDLTQATKGS
jgi:ABC-type transport system substrate-binding protein